MDGQDAIPKCKLPVYRSVRWHIAILLFFAYVFTYVLRVDFSIALVCMVRAENKTSDVEENATTTPRQEIGGDFVGCDDNTGGQVIEQRGEFDWDKSLQSKLLASFFYGYILTQIAGGWLARRYGTRIVMGTGLLICILCTILLPICARTHVYLVFAARVIMGMSTGIVFPAGHCLWGRWAPPLERTKLSAFAFVGVSIGTIIGMTLSGVFCAYGFDNGWASIFYIFGSSAVLWAFGWFYVVRDTPSKHPRITEMERHYIEASIGESYKNDRELSTPWLELFKSPAVWAGIIAHCCNNWTVYTLLTGLPTYMKEVLQFDIRQVKRRLFVKITTGMAGFVTEPVIPVNGALSALPYLCESVSGVAVGNLADFLRKRGTLSTRNTRRFFQSLSFLGMATFMVATGFITCERRYLAIVFLCLALAFVAFSRGGFLVNHIDIGPRYAGELFGITNTFATIPGMIAPIVNGALTPNKSQDEWQKVFYMCAGFAMFGAIVFFIFVRGEPQSWNNLANPSTAYSDVKNTRMEKKSGSNNKGYVPDISEKDINRSDIMNSQILPAQAREYPSDASPGQSLGKEAVSKTHF